MSKIIVRRQEYANNGTHANEIEAVVKDNLIVNTLSSALDVAPSVGLLNSVKSEIDEQITAHALAELTAIHLDAQYGSAYPINIDTLQGDRGYIYRCVTGSNFSGTSPTSVIGGNAFLLIGFSQINQTNQLPQYGVQLAIGFGQPKIAIRNRGYDASGAAWSSWVAIT